MNSFFRELKERKVYRVALGYAVVAWLVIQISATVMPVYHAPEWILPIFITAVALGFPVALVLAWAFELKGGVIGKTPESGGGLSATNKRRVWLLAAVGLIISALAIGGYWLWYPWRNASAAKLTTRPLLNLLLQQCRCPREKSIAVLPFENLSEDKDKRLFCRRHSRGNPDAPGQDCRLKSHFTHFHAAVSEQTGQSRRDREAAWRSEHS